MGAEGQALLCSESLTSSCAHLALSAVITSGDGGCIPQSLTIRLLRGLPIGPSDYCEGFLLDLLITRVSYWTFLLQQGFSIGPPDHCSLRSGMLQELDKLPIHGLWWR